MAINSCLWYLLLSPLLQWALLMFQIQVAIRGIYQERKSDTRMTSGCHNAQTQGLATLAQQNHILWICVSQEKIVLKIQPELSLFRQTPFIMRQPTSSYADSQERYTHVESKDWSQIKDHPDQPIHLSDSFNANNDCNVSLRQLGNSSNVAQVLTWAHRTIREKHLIATEDNVISVRWVGLSSNAPSEGLLLPNHNIHREELVNVADVDDKREENANRSRQRVEYDPVSSLRNSCESTGGAECSSDENASEISVASQPMQVNDFEDDSDSSMVDSVSISKITPDVVIETIGKQHFWKARKAILRKEDLV